MITTGGGAGAPIIARARAVGGVGAPIIARARAVGGGGAIVVLFFRCASNQFRYPCFLNLCLFVRTCCGNLLQLGIGLEFGPHMLHRILPSLDQYNPSFCSVGCIAVM